MYDPLIESAKEIEALREKVAELGDGLTIAYMAGAAKVADQLAAMTQERDRNWSNATANAMRLVYAQAHIKELREALERIAKYPRVRGDELGYEGCRQVASKALAIPDDQSALDAALKAEANKWADMAMAHGCTYMVTQIRNLT